MSTNQTMRISLNKLLFVGYHGLYPEEKKLGNNYSVEIDIDFTPKQGVIDQLDQTIDYVHVYAIVKKWMEIPTPLLETLVGKIADDILSSQTLANKVFVKITKLHLPIPSFEGNVSVKIEKSRS
ncbi:MAG: dihydroneopterin aldolase [Bacteroidetes bacterium]|jgi:dihydroneopterin aldolase|nr:dihydroneopterin aldolase [Bacteroidota bacterium]NBR56619.1 dihydroneopterin aldolase [Chitinophagia bacterium]